MTGGSYGRNPPAAYGDPTLVLQAKFSQFARTLQISCKLILINVIFSQNEENQVKKKTFSAFRTFGTTDFY